MRMSMYTLILMQYADDHAVADYYANAESYIDGAQVREELAKSDQREVDSGTEISGNS